MGRYAPKRMTLSESNGHSGWRRCVWMHWQPRTSQVQKLGNRTGKQIYIYTGKVSHPWLCPGHNYRAAAQPALVLRRHFPRRLRRVPSVPDLCKWSATLGAYDDVPFSFSTSCPGLDSVHSVFSRFTHSTVNVRNLTCLCLLFVRHPRAPRIPEHASRSRALEYLDIHPSRNQALART